MAQAKASGRRKKTSTSDGKLRYTASLVRQGKNRFYTLTLPTSVLARTCFVTTRIDDPKDGFQRTLERQRARDIADYINEGGSIPNSIVLSAQEAAGLKSVGRGRTIEFNDTPKAFLILDGQHRVYGFSLTEEELRVPVVIYNNLSRIQEARLFIDINTKQRPVPNALLLDIRKLAQYQTEEESFLSQLFDEFNSRTDSPLLGLLSRAEQVPGKISRVTFNNAVRPAAKMFADFELDDTYGILRAYLKVWADGLKGQKVEDALTKSVVFRAIMATFPRIVERVKDRHGARYTEETFGDVLTTEYFKSIKRPMKGNYGNSVRAFQEKLLNAFAKTVTL